MLCSVWFKCTETIQKDASTSPIQKYVLKCLSLIDKSFSSLMVSILKKIVALFSLKKTFINVSEKLLSKALANKKFVMSLTSYFSQDYELQLLVGEAVLVKLLSIRALCYRN